MIRAQDINGSFVSLGAGAAQRGAVLGALSAPADADWYSFTLAAGQAATVASTGDAALELYAIAFEEAGASVATRAASLKAADIILTVQAPDADGLKDFPAGAILIGTMNPYQRKDALAAYASAGLIATGYADMVNVPK